MRQFKLPLIVTGIALAVALIVGIVGVTCIHREKISSRKKTARAQRFGAGVGLATCLVAAPFWLVAAAKVGKKRREARAAGQARRKQ